MAREPTFPPSLKTAAALTALLVAAAILYLAQAVLIPVALALLLTFLLAPLVRRLERLRVPRVPATFMAVGISTLFVGSLGWLVQGELLELATHLPEYKTNLQNKLDQMRPPPGGILEKARSAISELSAKSIEPESTEPESKRPAEAAPLPVQVVNAPTPPFIYAKNFLGTILHPIATAGIVLLFAIFMLIKREDMRNRFIRLLGLREMHITTPALDDAAQRVSRYLLAQSITNGAAGLVIGIGFYFLHIPGALVWGLLTFLLRFVPYVGIWVAAALPVAISLSASPDWTDPLLAVALVAVVELIIANAIEPLLFGSRIGVSPLAILATSVFWAWLWGPVGLLLSMPLTVCLAVIGRHVPTLEFLDIILGDEPVLTPQLRLYQRLLSGDAEEAGDIVVSFSKDKPLPEVFDELILPAIRIGEFSRRRGPSDPERDRMVTDLFNVTIEDLAGRSGRAPAPAVSARRVLCLPARDTADQLVVRMLVSLLVSEGVEAQEVPADTLTGELIQQIESTPPAALCISAVPPGSLVHTRVLCKRIRARFPDLPIVVGLWDPSINIQTAGERLGVTGPLHIVTGLQSAAAQIRALARLDPAV